MDNPFESLIPRPESAPATAPDNPFASLVPSSGGLDTSGIPPARPRELATAPAPPARPAAQPAEAEMPVLPEMPAAKVARAPLTALGAPLPPSRIDHLLDVQVPHVPDADAAVRQQNANDAGFLSRSGDALQRGVLGLRQSGNTLQAGVNARELASLDAIEKQLAAGVSPDMIPDAKDPTGIRYASPAERQAYRAQITKGLGDAATAIAGREADKDLIPAPQVVKDFTGAKTWGDAWAAFKKDPVGIISGVGLESLPASAPGMVAAIPGAIAAGPAGAAAAMGGFSYGTDYLSSILEALGDEKVDLKDRAAVERAFSDPTMVERIGQKAHAHAAVVGTLDAASMGVAGKNLIPSGLVAGAGRREAANLAAQPFAQGALGAAGEAGGQIASGDALKPGSIAAEAAGEFATAPIDMLIAGISGGRARLAKIRAGQSTPAEIDAFLQEAEVAKATIQPDTDAAAAFAGMPARTLLDDVLKLPPPEPPREQAPDRDRPVAGSAGDPAVQDPATAAGPAQVDPSLRGLAAGAAADVDGGGPVPAPEVRAAPLADTPETRTLLGAGFAPDQIADMGTRERARAAREAADAGATPFTGPLPVAAAEPVDDDNPFAALIPGSPSNEAAKVGDTGQNVRETPATLAAQQEQLVAGERAVQMFPAGTKALPKPDGMERVETPRGVYDFDPAKVTADQVVTASRGGRENELLGLGPYTKDDVEARAAQTGEPLVSVTERRPDGTEVRAALGTPSTTAEQLPAMEAGKSPGNIVSVEPVEETLLARRPDGSEKGRPAAEVGSSGDRGQERSEAVGESAPGDLGRGQRTALGRTEAGDRQPAGNGDSPPRVAPKPARKRASQSLIQFIAGTGGLRPDPELDAIGMGSRFVPGKGRVVRKTGLPLDMAREAAAEAGFLPMNSTVADFLDLLDGEARGQKVYRPEDAADAYDAQAVARTEDPARAENDARNALLDFMEEEGLQPDRIDPEVLQAAVSRVLAGEQLDTAWERAVMEDFADDDQIVSAHSETGIPFEIPFDDDGSAAEVGRDLPEGGGDRGRAAAEDEAAERGRDHDRAGEEERAPREGDEAEVAPAPGEERGAEGKPQTVIPGAEKIGDGELAQRKADQGLKAKAPQKDTDGLALFGDARNQTDLMDLPAAAPAAEGKRPTPAEHEETRAAFIKRRVAEMRKTMLGTVDLPAEDTDTTIEASVTETGPWDFNDTWPAPDFAKVAAAEFEGRYVFEGGEDDRDARQVISVLDESLGTLVSYAADARYAFRELAQLRAGKVKLKRGETVEKATKRIEAARAAAHSQSRDLAGTLGDAWSKDAVAAALREARRRATGEIRAVPARPMSEAEAKDQAEVPTAEDSEGTPLNVGDRVSYVNLGGITQKGQVQRIFRDRSLAEANAGKPGKVRVEVGSDTGSGNFDPAKVTLLGAKSKRTLPDGARASLGPRPTPQQAQAIARAKRGIELAIRTEGRSTNVVTRPDLGPVIVEWGQPGDPTKSHKGGFGLAHILARRTAEGENAERFVRETLPDVLVRGEISRRYGPPRGERVDLRLGNAMATLSLYRDRQRETWLLTAFNVQEGVGSGDRPGFVPGDDLRSLDPSDTRVEEGAEPTQNVVEAGGEGKVGGGAGTIPLHVDGSDNVDPASPSQDGNGTDRRFKVRPDAAAGHRAAIEAAVEIIRRVGGPAVTIRLHERLSAGGDAARASGGQQGDAASGYYDGIAKAIGVSLSAFDVRDTAHHEAFHALQDMGVITPAEKQVLDRERERLRAYVGRTYGFGSEATAGMPDYEVEAYAYGAFATARDRADPSAGVGLHIAIRRAFERIYETFQRVRNALRGLGLQRAEDIFERARAGEMQGRAGSDGSAANGVRYRVEPPVNSVEQQPFERPPARPGIVDTARRYQQDKFLPLLRAQEAIQKASGAAIPETLDAYLAVDAYYTKTPAQTKAFTKKHSIPLVEAMHEERVTPEELGGYLYARHAPERNAVMRTRDPDRFSDGNGSGMTDEAARDLIADFEADGKLAALERLAERVDAIIAFSRDTMLESGLLSDEQVAGWDRVYKHYVPLRGFAEMDADDVGTTRPLGRGFDMRGKEVRAALGRMSKAENPLYQVLEQADRSIARAEENRVAKTFFLMVQANEHSELWRADKPNVRKVLDERTGLVKEIVDTLSSENVVTAKFGGKPRTVTVYDPHIIEAFKSLGEAKVNKYLASFARGYSQLLTSRNPDFFIVNVFRDVQEASFTLSEHKLATEFLTTWPEAFAASVRHAAGLSAGAKWTPLIEEFERSGGRIAYNALKDAATYQKEVERLLKELDQGLLQKTPKLAIRGLLKVLDGTNEALEGATRLAAFVAARNKGFSPGRAASIARESTVNFNRRGSLTPHMNVAYLFYNANVQGNAKVIGTLRRSKRARLFYASMIPLGIALTLLNRALSGDDEDDEDGRKLYDTISAWDRTNNFIFVLPDGVKRQEGFFVGKVMFNGKARYYGKFPVAFGLKIPLKLGEQAVLVQAGVVTPWKAAGNMIATTIDAFNPLGSGSLLAMISPTLVKPIVELYMNEDFKKKPIYPQGTWSEGVARSAQVYPSTSPVFTTIAQTLNAATGGDRYRAGLVDVYPAGIEHAFGWATGGLGRFIGNGAQVGINWAQDVPTPIEKWPIVRRFAGEIDYQEGAAKYRELKAETQESVNRLNAAKKDLGKRPDDSEALVALQREAEATGVRVDKRNDYSDSVMAPFRAADKDIRALRDQQQTIRRDKALTPRARYDENVKLESEIERIMSVTRREARDKKRAMREAREGARAP